MDSRMADRAMRELSQRTRARWLVLMSTDSTPGRLRKWRQFSHTAGRAGNALQHQRRLAHVATPVADKTGLQGRGVVQPQPRQQLIGQRVGLAGLGSAVAVIIAQAAVENGLRHRLAAGAAGVLGVAVLNGEIHPRRHRLATGEKHVWLMAGIVTYRASLP